MGSDRFSIMTQQVLTLAQESSMETNISQSPEVWRLLKAIGRAALIVGTLDIIAATIQTLISGQDPIEMLQFIASGMFGTSAFRGGSGYAIWGLFFHYCIVVIWTTILFVIYPKFDFLSWHKVLTGIGYGLFVKIGMSGVVLPLSNTPGLRFTIQGEIISTAILIMAIGLPLSFLVNKFYQAR